MESRPSLWMRLAAACRTELGHLTMIHPTDRPWELPVGAAIAIGLPLFIGAFFDRLDFGLASSLGGLCFMYLPATALSHRMVMQMACAFGLIACYALGVMSQFVPLMAVPVLTFSAILVTMVCRFYGVGMPGSLFFVMVAAIGADLPVTVLEVPARVGLVAMGAVLACLIGFLYSIHVLRRRAPQQPPPPTASFDFVVFDSVVIGVCVGLSTAVAKGLGAEQAYWVPVSCLAVIQGASLRAVWTKKLQRILGTLAGLLLTWGLFLLPLGPWTIALTMTALILVIETMVVRHYGLAVMFITPLTILLAEATTMGQGPAADLMQARLFDTVLGSFVGLLGGIALHSPRFRGAAGGAMRRLIPARFRGGSAPEPATDAGADLAARGE
ncbi:MAG: FUSC family protein [Alphaproteobacteria bacterium]|nr:FUSC family protein [Alphaproteobacteria bacterium]